MKKYKTFYYKPRSKYIYFVYDLDEMQIGEYLTCKEIEEDLGLKRNSLTISFSRKKTNEIKFKKHYVYRFRSKDYKDMVLCMNCKELVPFDYGKLTETDGFICEQCLIDGYGK